MTDTERLAREAEYVRYGAAAERLHKAVSALEPDAVTVLAYIAERLVAGRQAYGDMNLATDKRNWMNELAQEAGDMAVYGACSMLSKSLAQ